MRDLSGKKLLILGGAFQHIKLVKAAKEMGIITYVTDYLPVEKSPAKQIADHWYMYNITDIDEIIELCKEKRIDGVISTNLDACQLPYQQICERLSLPCFGTKEQYYIYTNKSAYKKWMLENNLDVIPAYTLSDFENEEICKQNVEFPVLVKPAVSRGSRGQTICDHYSEIENAIAFAESESMTGGVVIEKYMGKMHDFSQGIIVINGKVYVERTSDRYIGSGKMDKSALLSVQPSAFTGLYEHNVLPKVKEMIKRLGLTTSPMMMQGFIDGETIRFYDPGLRFGGFEYETMFNMITGINPLDYLIEYALTGEVSEETIGDLENAYKFNGKKACIFYIPILPGVISTITGVEAIRNDNRVICIETNYKVGDSVGEHYNVRQRFCEIDFIANGDEEIKEIINWIYSILSVKNENGEEMIFSRFNTNDLITEKSGGGYYQLSNPILNIATSDTNWRCAA